jgi:choline dehydrogenase-like flavoprotein
VPYEVTQPNLTNDIHVHHKDGFGNSLATYQASRSGFFATFPFGVFALARLDDALASSPLWRDRSAATAGSNRDAANLTSQQAHVEYMHTELYSGHIHGRDVPLDGKHGFEMMTLLFSQQSRGTVTLRSADPHDKPVIDPRYLSDPLDLLMLTEGVRFAHSVVTSGSGTRDVVAPGVWMAGPEYAALGPVTTAQDWEEYVRRYSATAHHPAGTCRMGKHDDPMAVVDETLRVKGVQGLMVADCSIIPSLNGGHTQMPAYAIGEKAAEMLVRA